MEPPSFSPAAWVCNQVLAGEVQLGVQPQESVLRESGLVHPLPFLLSDGCDCDLIFVAPAPSDHGVTTGEGSRIWCSHQIEGTPTMWHPSYWSVLKVRE